MQHTCELFSQTFFTQVQEVRRFAIAANRAEHAIRRYKEGGCSHMVASARLRHLHRGEHSVSQEGTNFLPGTSSSPPYEIVIDDRGSPQLGKVRPLGSHRFIASLGEMLRR